MVLTYLGRFDGERDWMHIARTEFEKWLRIGLGRAVVFLRQQDGYLYREAILYACLHDLRFDRQVEWRRGGYLYDVVQASGEPEYFRDRIIEKLFPLPDPELDDAEPFQWMEFLRHFAEMGDTVARNALYSAFLQNTERQDYRGAGELILLDGIDGFRTVMRTYIDTLEVDEDMDDIQDWIWELKGKLKEELGEKEGEQSAEEQLQRLSQQDPDIGVRLAAVTAIGAIPLKTDGNRDKPLGYDEIVQMIDAEAAKMRAKGTAPRNMKFRGIGQRRATPEALERFAIDIESLAPGGSQQQGIGAETYPPGVEELEEKQRDRLLAMLRLFGSTPFSHLPAPLIELAQDADMDIRFAAMQALEHIAHPAVRRFALNLIAERRTSHYGNAVDMLTTNFEAGDFALVTPLLTQEMEAWAFHNLCMGVRQMAERYTMPDAIPSLLLLYENGLCGICRSSTVELLHRLGALTEAMRKECLYDAYPHTRAWAAEIG